MAQFDIGGVSAALLIPATETGTQLATDLANFANAVKSKNSGTARPTYNSGSPPAGLEWLDNNTSPWAVKIFDGTSDLIIGWVDNTNHQWIPAPTGGVTAIAAAATINLSTAKSFYVSVTGVSGASITSFGTVAAGVTKRLVWASTQTQPVTHNATSMILPGGANITPQAGDCWDVMNVSAAGTPSGNWKVTGISTTAAPSSVISGAFTTSGVVTSGSLTSPQNALAPGANTSVYRLVSAVDVQVNGMTGGTNGRRMTLINANAPGGKIFTFAPKNVAATDVNQFGDTLDNPLPPGGTVTFEYDATATNTTGATGAWLAIGSTTTASPTPPSFKNLVISNGGTPNSQMLITADAVVVADASGLFSRMLVVVSEVADLTVSGAGGMDTGSRPVSTASWLYLYVIYAPVSGSVAALISLSATAPTLPTGYTLFCRVGAAPVNNANPGIFYQIRQNGRSAHYVLTNVVGQIPQTIPNVSSGGNTNPNFPTTINNLSSSGTLPLVVPPTASMATVIASNRFAAQTPTANVAVAPVVSSAWTQTGWGPAGSAGNSWPIYLNGGAIASAMATIDLEGTVALGYASDNNGGGLSVWGWEDNL